MDIFILTKCHLYDIIAIMKDTSSPEHSTHRISIGKLLKTEGFDNLYDFLEVYAMESVVPALCDEGCQVEPDGRCPHGCPSPLIVLGMI